MLNQKELEQITTALYLNSNPAIRDGAQFYIVNLQSVLHLLVQYTDPLKAIPKADIQKRELTWEVIEKGNSK